ncbi:hypothetical protein [Nitrolancea hollandica]|uniref:SpoVT / AbrB like domain protein n=1 Tax=Nitrolancea hollandica Lb TaxID=1129897 RepID=I4EHS6_9BACT
MKRKPAGSKIAQGYGAVTPKNRPEDFRELREAFERGVADKMVSEP